MSEGLPFDLEILGFGARGDPFGRLDNGKGAVCFVRGADRVLKGEVLRVQIIQKSDTWCSAEVVK